MSYPYPQQPQQQVYYAQPGYPSGGAYPGGTTVQYVSNQPPPVYYDQQPGPGVQYVQTVPGQVVYQQPPPKEEGICAKICAGACCAALCCCCLECCKECC